jgi:hypothetical protein
MDKTAYQCVPMDQADEVDRQQRLDWERAHRGTIVRASLDECDEQDVAYWLSKTPSERIAGVEALRRWFYGESQVDQGLQRVFELAELGQD